MTRYERNVNQVNADFTAIKNKIIETGVDVPTGTPTADYASKVDEVFNTGKSEATSEFWEGALSPPIYQYRFAGRCWNDRTFYPTKNIKLSDYSNHAFYISYITDLAGRLRECGVTLDTSGAKSRCDSLFQGCSLLTTVPYLDVSKCTYSAVLNSMFNGCSALKTIEGIRLAADGSQKLGTGTFTNCAALENIIFDGIIGDNLTMNACTKLSGPSIRNIVDHLSDTASGKTLTLSQTAVNNADFGSVATTITMFTPGGGYTGLIYSDPITLSAGQSVKVDWEWNCLTPRPEDGSNTTTFNGIYITKDGSNITSLQNNIFTALDDGTYYICWDFSMYTMYDMTDVLKARIVLVDADGAEITGENLCYFKTEVPEGFYGLNHLITSIEEVNRTWGDLVATKPNWTFNLA